MGVEPVFEVHFWGVRGTVPCPGPATLRYGGNTACVEMLCGTEHLIFDAGTGIRVLGNELKRQGQARKAHLFLTHTHFDHINGFPFFQPAYCENNSFQIWSGHPSAGNMNIQKTLAALMDEPYFPVPIDIMHACVGFNDFVAGDLLEPVEGVRVRTGRLNHPGGATGYRVEYAGRAVCYVTDTEHVEGKRDARIVELIADSDIVIYDATYTDAQYPNYRGWGHSTWEEGVRLCEEAGARRLVTFHHDPDSDDEYLDRVAADVDRARPGSVVAHEGMVIKP